jgi:hypothetical protein
MDRNYLAIGIHEPRRSVLKVLRMRGEVGRSAVLTRISSLPGEKLGFAALR